MGWTFKWIDSGDDETMENAKLNIMAIAHNGKLLLLYGRLNCIADRDEGPVRMGHVVSRRAACLLDVVMGYADQFQIQVSFDERQS